MSSIYVIYRPTRPLFDNIFTFSLALNANRCRSGTRPLSSKRRNVIVFTISRIREDFLHSVGRVSLVADHTTTGIIIPVLDNRSI